MNLVLAIQLWLIDEKAMTLIEGCCLRRLPFWPVLRPVSANRLLDPRAGQCISTTPFVEFSVLNTPSHQSSL